MSSGWREPTFGKSSPILFIQNPEFLFKAGGHCSAHVIGIKYPSQCDSFAFGINEADAFGGAVPRVVAFPFEGNALMRLAVCGGGSMRTPYRPCQINR